MCDKQTLRDLAWLKAEGERFRKELGMGEDGKYPEMAEWIKRVKRDPK
jgi:hypothetical protein